MLDLNLLIKTQELVTEPLAYTFMRNALIEIVLISILVGVVGTFIILKNLAFISEALAHAVFPGVVVAFLMKINLLLGAFAAAILTVLGIGITSNDKKISESTATGIFFSTAFAIGIVLISSTQNYRANLTSFLIGDVLSVTQTDIFITAIVAAIVIGIITVFYKRFVLISFDQTYARSIGLKVKRLNFLLLFCIAASIVVSIQVVGNILVIALLIIPAAAARLTAKRIPSMLKLAIIYSLIWGVVGLYASYYLEVAAGAMIVLCNSAWFSLIFLLTRFRKEI